MMTTEYHLKVRYMSLSLRVAYALSTKPSMAWRGVIFNTSFKVCQKSRPP